MPGLYRSRRYDRGDRTGEQCTGDRRDKQRHATARTHWVVVTAASKCVAAALGKSSVHFPHGFDSFSMRNSKVSFRGIGTRSTRTALSKFSDKLAHLKR
jgi:hypothetical protein